MSLTALLAYLTRGRGDRAAVLSEIRQSSRLGPKVAQWLEQNETRLRNNPRLKPRETKGATAPVEEPKARGEKPKQDADKKALMRSRKISRDEYKKWLENNNYRNIDDHVKSADASKPVEIVEFKKGDVIQMYVRDNGAPGSYRTVKGTSPESLAIDGTGRHVEVFVVKEPFEAIRSTAGEFPTGVYPGVGGPGGGIQYQLPNGYQNSVIKR